MFNNTYKLLSEPSYIYEYKNLYETFIKLIIENPKNVNSNESVENIISYANNCEYKQCKKDTKMENNIEQNLEKVLVELSHFEGLKENSTSQTFFPKL